MLDTIGPYFLRIGFIGLCYAGPNFDGLCTKNCFYDFSHIFRLILSTIFFSGSILSEIRFFWFFFLHLGQFSEPIRSLCGGCHAAWWHCCLDWLQGRQMHFGHARFEHLNFPTFIFWHPITQIIGHMLILVKAYVVLHRHTLHSWLHTSSTSLHSFLKGPRPGTFKIIQILWRWWRFS